MKIAVAQIAPIVGAFDFNLQKIKESYELACREQANLLITPELGVCGYPLLDLLDRPEIFQRNEKSLQELLELTKGRAVALAVGHVKENPEPRGRRALNHVSVFYDGEMVHSQSKTLLPTYGVFDEARYFEPARSVSLWNFKNKKIGIAICEDLWGADPQLVGRTYSGGFQPGGSHNPVAQFKEQGAELILSLSSSPYEWGKRQRREALHQSISKDLEVPLIYVNQVGATDEILFDGASFSTDSRGQVTGRLSVFESSFGVVEVVEGGSSRWLSPSGVTASESDIEILARGLVTGIREYFERTGFKTAIVGLSGGIDSAVVATLAVKALGARHVMGVAMPSQYSSSHSLADAEELAKNLGIPFEVKNIKFLFSAAVRHLSEGRGELSPIALENIQPRLRALQLMTLANHYQSLVLTTGNKSELAVGYCTSYGDMVGALAPIGDLYKTRVYELARYINEAWGAPIPVSTLEKPPSAELKPDQKDLDTLPPYDELDALLEDYIEKKLPVEEILEKHSTSAKEILKMIERNEYKRRQAAPTLKVSTRAFGIGRRIPIAKKWNSTD